MTTFKQAIIDALEKKYEAQRSEAEANIKVYMWDDPTNDTGGGSAHPNRLSFATYNTGDLAVNIYRLLGS